MVCGRIYTHGVRVYPSTICGFTPNLDKVVSIANSQIQMSVATVGFMVVLGSHPQASTVWSDNGELYGGEVGVGALQGQCGERRLL